MSHATVASLLNGIDRYNPENLQTLEAYVGQQVREGTYDLEANLAVLKLYQFNPHKYQSEVTAQILLKALTNLPHTDFTLCRCLIDTEHQKNDRITNIIMLATLLEMCEFSTFWDQVMTTPEWIYEISGFEDSIRKYICHVVSITYQTLHFDKLAELLGRIPENDVHVWIKKYLWSIHERDNVFVTWRSRMSLNVSENDVHVWIKKYLWSIQERDNVFVTWHSRMSLNVSEGDVHEWIKKYGWSIQERGNVWAEPGIFEGDVHEWIKKYGWSIQERGNVFVAQQDEIIKPKNITEKITFDNVAAIMASSRGSK